MEQNLRHHLEPNDSHHKAGENHRDQKTECGMRSDHRLQRKKKKKRKWLNEH